MKFHIYDNVCNSTWRKLARAARKLAVKSKPSPTLARKQPPSNKSRSAGFLIGQHSDTQKRLATRLLTRSAWCFVLFFRWFSLFNKYVLFIATRCFFGYARCSEKGIPQSKTEFYDSSSSVASWIHNRKKLKCRYIVEAVFQLCFINFVYFLRHKKISGI